MKDPPVFSHDIMKGESNKLKIEGKIYPLPEIVLHLSTTPGITTKRNSTRGSKATALLYLTIVADTIQ
jgi:hypothetical protein